MDYFVTKKVNNKEWRIYFSDDAKSPGKILFKGHKLSLTLTDVSEILEYRVERSSGTYFFVDYCKLHNKPDIKNREMWFQGTNPIDLIQKSWDTLELKLMELKPDLKKILITENFV